MKPVLSREDLIKQCAGCRRWSLQYPWDTPPSVVAEIVQEHFQECPPVQRLYIAKYEGGKKA